MSSSSFLAHISRIKRVSDAIATRQSIRNFLKKSPISQNTLEEILSNASRAPSWGNLQPWKVYVVSGEKKEQISQAVQNQILDKKQHESKKFKLYPDFTQIADTYLARKIQTESERCKKLGIAYPDASVSGLLDLELMEKNSPENLYENYWDFYNAPIGLFFTIDENMQPGQFSDIGMFMQNVMLLSRERGFHTCIQESWAKWPVTLQRELNLPSNEMIFCGMAAGYADFSDKINNLDETNRVPLKDFATFYFDEGTKNSSPSNK